ncbi:MAG: hypothetical protein KAT37_03890 [Candidatus Aenigmarchaeota archaeon]|nr:hypothetical protein [Candidatus Aenigmarchaeota archaeon]
MIKMVKEILHKRKSQVEDFYLEDHWIGQGGQTHYTAIIPIKIYPTD